MQGRVVAIVLAVIVAAVAAQALLSGGDPSRQAEPLLPGASQAPGESSGDDDAAPTPVDPLAWRSSRSNEYAAAAARGFAHPLYARVPGGPRATAERVMRYRSLIEAAAPAAGVDADTIEAMVYLESAGLPDAVADPKLVGAVGLTQILAETGTSLLGLRVNPVEARKLTRRIARAERRGRVRTAERLRAERRRVDERFDPAKAIPATARYLAFARRELGGRSDLAVASYHMGVGNLQNVLKEYGDEDVSYAKLYFDATSLRHPQASRMLASFGDDSSSYLWRVRAAQEVMRLARSDPGELDRRAALMSRKASAEEYLHPQDDTEEFTGPRDLRDAYDKGVITKLPAGLLARYGVRVDPEMGELAPELGQKRSLYRGLRPEALATLLYLAAGVSGDITLTSTVRDRPYQRRLVAINSEATREFSLHTTGYAFDLLKRFRSAAQEREVRGMLRTLQAHDLIAWVEEPAAFHVVAGDRAKALLDVLDQAPAQDDAETTG